MHRNRLALAALLAGIAAFLNLLGLEKGILAIVIGYLALAEMKQSQTTEGKGLVWAGLILGAVSILLILGLIIFKGPEIFEYLRNLPRVPRP